MATIPDTALVALARQAVGIGSIAPWTYLALDASDAAESASHTGPLAEIVSAGGERKAATVTVEGTKSVLSAIFGFTGPLTINAVCILNAATAGTGIMLVRHLWPAPKNVANQDSLEVIMKMDNQRP